MDEWLRAGAGGGGRTAIVRFMTRNLLGQLEAVRLGDPWADLRARVLSIFLNICFQDDAVEQQSEPRFPPLPILMQFKSEMTAPGSVFHSKAAMSSASGAA